MFAFCRGPADNACFPRLLVAQQTNPVARQEKGPEGRVARVSVGSGV